MGAKVRLNGNLGDDPRSGKTNDGKPYVTFSVYQPHWVSTGKKSTDGRDEFEDVGGFWMNVAWFNRKAEKAAQVLRKGAAVLIEGDMRVEHWTDKETGEYKSQWKVVADEVTLDFRSLESVEYRRREQQGSSVPPPLGNRAQAVQNGAANTFGAQGIDSNPPKPMGSVNEGSLGAGSFEAGRDLEKHSGINYEQDDGMPI